MASGLLAVAARGFGTAVALRNMAYDRRWTRAARLPCRVISVGNLTVGGTGKTACVELIAQHLAQAGRRLAILSRGYGGARRAYWLRWAPQGLLVDGALAAEILGLADEPRLLARHLPGIPVLVGSRRDRTGRVACEQFGAEVVILDDGFQHRQLARDCDVVLVHARMPFAGWPLLPRGPMREPVASLARAQIVIITKADEALERVGALAERLRSLSPKALVLTAAHEPMGLIDVPTGRQEETGRLAGYRVGLLSSIGDPRGFEETVRRLGAEILWHRAFPDHHPYRAEDLATLAELTQATRPQAIVTTEKDWVRLEPLASLAALAGQSPSWHAPVWVLRVALRLLTGEAEFHARLNRLCAG